jgi:polyhydroxyalkanoate synthesis regulator phasin
MRDAMRGYLHAASGLTELTRKRAQELAQSLLAAGGSQSTAGVAAQVSSVAEELISAAKSNRAAVREMVRGEVEVAVARLGLVPATELERAHRKIAKLEATVAELVRGGSRGGASGSSTGRWAPGATAESGGRPSRAAVKKAAAKKAPATKTAAKKAAAKKATAKKATAKKATAKKAAVKKAPATKTTAKKTTKSTRARSAPGTGTGAETSS